MQIPPEALTSLGYILGGLVVVFILRRGDIEKAVDSRISQLGKKPDAPILSAAPALTPLAAGLPLDDTNPRLILAFLERISRDLDHERESNREQFARVWSEINSLTGKEKG